MKGSLALSLLSAAAVSAVAVYPQLDRRQLPNIKDWMNMFKGQQKAFKLETGPSDVHPKAKQLHIIYGPFDINPSDQKMFKTTGFSMDPHGTGYSALLDSDFPRDITILKTLSYATDENFKRVDTADGLYNHHDVFFDMGKPALNYLGCNGKSMPPSPVNILMGGATEVLANHYYRNTSGINSGYYIKPNSKIAFMLDMVNYKNVPRKVYVEAWVDYLDGKQDGWLDSQNTVINLGLCDGGMGFMANNVHAPKGVSKFALKAKNPVEITKDGYIIFGTGHLHDGGLQMEISVNDKLTCVSKAEYGGEGHTAMINGKEWKTIAMTTPCPEAIKLAKGDKVMLEAKFDFDQHPARESAHGEVAEGMALFTATFAS